MYGKAKLATMRERLLHNRQKIYHTVVSGLKVYMCTYNPFFGMLNLTKPYVTRKLLYQHKVYPSKKLSITVIIKMCSLILKANCLYA